MGDLEPTSRPQAREAEPGRMRHTPHETLTRHLHGHAFATVVLSGGYVEAGDTGRHCVAAGDVLLHRAWESHLDRFGPAGADVLVVDIADGDAQRPSGRISDPDAVVRLGERDQADAARLLFEAFVPTPMNPTDWPDILAQALSDDPGLAIGAWADAHGLQRGSVSRGFRQVFGIAPVGYRLIQRIRRAIAEVQTTTKPLSLIAQDCSFADQAHMSRALKRLVRTSPGALRRAA